MIVYRMMSKEELKLYLNGDIKNIGNIFPNFKFDESVTMEQKMLAYINWEERKSNNHYYAMNQKYVHFFRRLKDMDYVQFERDFEYLATFDIPTVVLMASKGKGFYKKMKHGKFKYKFVREFAVKAEEIKPEYFLGFEEINVFKHDVDGLMKLAK